MLEYALRYCIGGVAVSAFAVLSDIFRPKSFAGLFGTATVLTGQIAKLHRPETGGLFLAFSHLR